MSQRIYPHLRSVNLENSFLREGQSLSKLLLMSGLIQVRCYYGNPKKTIHLTYRDWTPPVWRLMIHGAEESDSGCYACLIKTEVHGLIHTEPKQLTCVRVINMHEKREEQRKIKEQLRRHKGSNSLDQKVVCKNLTLKNFETFTIKLTACYTGNGKLGNSK